MHSFDIVSAVAACAVTGSLVYAGFRVLGFRLTFRLERVAPRSKPSANDDREESR